ncbi:MAG: DNA recombination protein RmuC, partial [Stellaceae bacterium]
MFLTGVVIAPAAHAEARQHPHQTDIKGALPGDAMARTAAALGAELKHLGETSRAMTTEAERLTRALTTQSQARGAWGEQVLNRVLEVAGLREGIDFVAQQTHQQEDGSRVRPDVIVNLPGGRRIIVDAKLALVDYTAYT